MQNPTPREPITAMLARMREDQAAKIDAMTAEDHRQEEIRVYYATWTAARQPTPKTQPDWL